MTGEPHRNNPTQVVLLADDDVILRQLYRAYLTKRGYKLGEKSSGVGLAITRHLVEAHDGKILAETEQGKGSTFAAEYPI